MKTTANSPKQRREAIEKILDSCKPLLMEAWSSTPGNDPLRSSKLGTNNKSGFADLVTVYDQRVESFLKAELERKFPGEAFVGEESSKDRFDAYEKIRSLDRFWIADPIDGTTNFSRAYPFFSCTLAWVEKTTGGYEVLAGGTLNPVSNELFSAHRGGGATLNQRPLRVSSVESPRECLFASGFVSLRQGKATKSFENFINVTQKSLGVRRDGSAALDLAFVATGRIDAYWETGLSPWDMAAGSLLVEEAGGKVSGPGGLRWTIFDSEIISSNGKIHSWVEKEIS